MKTDPIHPGALAALRRHIHETAQVDNVADGDLWLTLGNARLMMDEIERLQAEIAQVRAAIGNSHLDHLLLAEAVRTQVEMLSAALAAAERDEDNRL